MTRTMRKVSLSGSGIVLLTVLNAFILKHAFVNDERWYWCLLITTPAIILVALLNGSTHTVMK